MSSILIKNALIVSMVDQVFTGDVYIEDGRIITVGVHIEMKADKEIDATGKVLMPGFINCHSMAGMGLFRGYSDELNSIEWYDKAVAPIEEKMTEEDVYNASMLSFSEMIKSGTTCVNDMYILESETCRAAEEIGIRGYFAERVIGMENSPKKFAKSEELYNTWNNKANDRIKIGIALHSAYTCSKEVLEDGKNLALRLDVPLHMQYMECKDELDIIKRRYGKSETDFLNDIGIFETNAVLAHGVWTNELDISKLRNNHPSIVNVPISDCKLGSGISDLYFLKSDINIALGTGGLGSTNTLDMFEQMKVCAYLQKTLYKQAQIISAKEICEMATINGAIALGLDGEIGTIEKGKKADLMLIDCNKISNNPIHDIYSTIVYSCTGNDVDTVIIDGNIVMEDRELVNANEKEVLKRAINSAKKVF